MKQSIKIIPFPEIENSFIVISANPSDTANNVKLCFTFLYATEKGGAEWEPEYGPITRLIPCKKNDPEAKKHWFYPYYKGQGHWSQLAVKDENLAENFINGNYAEIFETLKEWS